MNESEIANQIFGYCLLLPVVRGLQRALDYSISRR